jgi:RNA-dependent RNA polymerase
MVGRTIQVHGFDLTDSAESVKDILERIAGTGTICAVKLRPPRNISANSRAFAIVQFQTQESASLVEDAARRNALRIGRFYLKARPAERTLFQDQEFQCFLWRTLCCIWDVWLRKIFYLLFFVQVMFRFNLDLI